MIRPCSAPLSPGRLNGAALSRFRSSRPPPWTTLKPPGTCRSALSSSAPDMSSIDRIVRSYRSLRLLCLPIGLSLMCWRGGIEAWEWPGIGRRPWTQPVALHAAPRPTQCADSVCTKLCPAQVSAIMAPRSDKYIDKAVRLVVDSGYTPREAYEAVPPLQERGETVLQHLRKQVRTARAKLDAPPAAKKQIAKKLWAPFRDIDSSRSGRWSVGRAIR